MSRARRRHNLVLGVDIGTTFSAVSFFVPTNDGKKDPVFEEVNRWPGRSTSDAKVPSVLYYDHRNKVRICGAEIEDVESIMTAEEKNWTKVEWWKLLLRPEYLAIPEGHSISPLPTGLTVDDVLCDFFAYIKKNVQRFVDNSYASGDRYWDEFAETMVVVLTTPNGWEGQNQNRMRQAAIKAKLLVGDRVRERVRFVSEGEAAIHHAFEGAKSYNWLAVGNIVLVCDAGGGTTDIAIYKIRSLKPLELEEISRPQCYVAGGIFVNLAAKEFLQRRFQGTAWDNPESIAFAINNFEQHAKRKFSGTGSHNHVDLGGGLSDEARGVIKGKLRLTRLGGPPRAHSKSSFAYKFVLVGGFADSPYVHSRIETWCRANDVSVKKPDGPLSKAIANGALSWHLRSGVRTRIARLHYGSEVQILYDPNDPEMVGREKYLDPKGNWRVRGAWQEIVRKDAHLRAGEDHSAWFHQEIRTVDDAVVEMELYAYRWSKPPRFLRTPDGILNDGFIFIGKVQGDLCGYFLHAKYEGDMGENQYKALQYEVCLSFDEIEIKASLHWNQGGYRMAGAATLVYDI